MITALTNFMIRQSFSPIHNTHEPLCLSISYIFYFGVRFDNTLPHTATMLQMYASTTHITLLIIILELVVHVWPHFTQLASTNFPCPDGMESWNPSMWTLGLHYPDKSMLKSMLISWDFPTCIMIVWLGNVCYIQHGIFVVRRNRDIDVRETRRWNIWVPDLHMSCRDWTAWQGTRLVATAMGSVWHAVLYVVVMMTENYSGHLSVYHQKQLILIRYSGECLYLW